MELNIFFISTGGKCSDAATAPDAGTFLSRNGGRPSQQVETDSALLYGREIRLKLL
jgi:hypothetical protein